jgi:hypothetical protein
MGTRATMGQIGAVQIGLARLLLNGRGHAASLAQLWPLTGTVPRLYGDIQHDVTDVGRVPLDPLHVVQAHAPIPALHPQKRMHLV